MTFLNAKEVNLTKKFLSDGYIIKKSNRTSLIYIENLYQKILKKIFKSKRTIDLNLLHKYIDYSDLNNFRLELIYKLNADKKLRYNYFNLASNELYSLAGNELMMQKNINLSIQFPNDNTSLLPIHSDVWSGDSPYEINLWVPLVDCYRTKSMYILQPKNYNKFLNQLKKKKIKSSKNIFRIMKKNLKWIKINKRNFLLFNQTLPHGNVINIENQTRVSMNCRFKGVYSPYGDKKIGEFFLPITKRAMSSIGDDYIHPFKS